MFWYRYEFSLPVSGKCQAGFDIVSGEIGKVGQDFCLRHSSGQVLENVSYSHPRSANSRFAAPLARFNGDDLAIIHTSNDNKSNSSCKII
jgi:hypothetical protein